MDAFLNNPFEYLDIRWRIQVLRSLICFIDPRVWNIDTRLLIVDVRVCVTGLYTHGLVLNEGDGKADINLHAVADVKEST